jgi:hypothetical protein
MKHYRVNGGDILSLYVLVELVTRIDSGEGGLGWLKREDGIKPGSSKRKCYVLEEEV